METNNSEYKYQATVFTITAKTNIHVGSGSQNYGVIDNLIQRDPLTGFPCIFSSSLKGAIREYFRHYLSDKDQNYKGLILNVFGFEKGDGIEDEEDNTEEINSSENKEENETKKEKGSFKQQAGKYRFLQADLLSFPVRSDKKLFYRTTSPYLLQNLKNQTELYRLNFNDEKDKEAISNISFSDTDMKAFHFSLESNAILEENEIVSQSVKTLESFKQFEKLQVLVGDDMSIVNDSDFAELVSDYHLPAIARNNLIDGSSTNLWYEQVLPSETRFWFAVLSPVGDKYLDIFVEKIQENPIQIGANASIGYGFCKIQKVEWFRNI